MRKHVGRIVQIIYVDRSDKLTQRTVRIGSIDGNAVKAYGLDRRAPSVFAAENILALRLVRSA